MSARRPRAPLAVRTLFVLSVMLLAGGVLLMASGAFGSALTTLAGGFNAAFNRLVATPVPTSTDVPPSDSPRIAAPEQPYTNKETVDLNITVPREALDDPNAKVRIYLALEGLEAAPVRDVPVEGSIRMVVSFTLTEGRNDISATLFRGSAESEPSPIVTWVFDMTPPKISIASPKEGSSVDTPNATIRGTTQAGSTLIARNPANNASITTVAARSGEFELELPLVPGENQITLKATDPAGNTAEKVLKVKQGSTEMRINLRASVYQISVKNHPSQLQLTVVVTDPSGNPLEGARAFFTLQIPGLAPISNELFTNPDGRASFTTPLVGTLQKGNGVGTVLVTHDTYGEATDRVTLTFVK